MYEELRLSWNSIQSMKAQLKVMDTIRIAAMLLTLTSLILLSMSSGKQTVDEILRGLPIVWHADADPSLTTLPITMDKLRQFINDTTTSLSEATSEPHTNNAIHLIQVNLGLMKQPDGWHRTFE